MGSQWFRTSSQGKSAKEAYQHAVDAAEDMYGHQEGYSGEINSSAGYRDVTKEYKASGKSLERYISDRQDVLTKHNGAEAICIREPKTNNNKIKSQVEHIVEKGTKKWVLKYYAQSDYKGLLGKFNTKGDALKAARKYTEETGNSTYVEMRKDLEKGNTITAKISYKRATNEAPGTWVFYGWASC
jgi:formylmethanofuran:tetrahydromethanopterin formyltransferase